MGSTMALDKLLRQIE